MSFTSFSIGRDTQLVVMGPTGRVDLTHVTGFEARQITQSVRVDRLDGTTLGTELPKGWEGTFELERGNSAVDDFIAAAEQQFFNNGPSTPGTMYQYITETDGSVSTYEYRYGDFQAGERRAMAGGQCRQAAARILRSSPQADLMSPTVSISQASAGCEMVNDTEGRRIAVRQLTALDKLRIFKAAGSVLAHNQPWLGMAVLACSVTAIDDIPVPMPSNEQQIEGLVARLGDPGIAAVASSSFFSEASEGGADLDIAGN